MTPATTFAGRTVALFGLGGSGLATALALQGGGARVVACDDSAEAMAQGRRAGDRDRRSAQRGLVALRRARPLARRAADPSRAALVGEARRRPPASRSSATSSCSAASARSSRRTHRSSPSPAPTASRRRRRSIAHILREAGRDVQMGGNIGTAILSLEPPASDRVHVVEMSSFQIDLTPSLKPTIGVLLNVSPDHLDRHGTMENTRRSRSGSSRAADLAVIGIDDEFEPRRRDAPCRLRQAARPHLDRAARFGGRVRRRRGLVSRRCAPAAEAFADISGIRSLRGSPQRPERGGGGRGRGCARRRRPERSAPGSRPSPASRTAWRRSAGAGGRSS